ncbi:hypothetical protein HZB69_04875 [Candidatus Amesbacteria bacterium]|nr:hypothetical protein [Candidatus Amesbacteria bacterium]
MLTSQDLKQIKSIVEEVVETKLEEKLNEKLKPFPTRDEFEKRIGLLPTKDVFLTKMDEVVGELQKTRDEHDSLTYRVSVHSDEISVLQDLHPNSKHIVAN